MSNLTYAMVIMISLNLVFILAQASITEINSEATSFYECNGTILGELSTGQCDNGVYVLADTDPANNIPSTVSSVDPDTGELYTDSLTTTRSWLLESTGLGYVVNLLSAPYNILKAMGLPSVFSFALGGLWYAITLFLIVAFILGRND